MTTTPHPTFPLVLEAVRSVLREHAAGRHVDPSRLAWARQIVALNPAHFPSERKAA